MEPEEQIPAVSLFKAFERPAAVVLVTCQMLMGLGLAIAVILKIYMLIFTDHQCVPDAATIGNMIRCTSTLEILAQFLMALATLQMAAMVFQSRPKPIVAPLVTGIAGVLMLVLSGVTAASARWELSLQIMALLAVLSGVYLALNFLHKRN